MKKRLDELLIDRNISDDLKKAQSLIMSGKILVNDVVEDKAGTKFDEKVSIRFKATKKTKYVSRGGLKLEKAIEYFDIDVENFVCIDVGCSTGGFTNVLLESKARKVFAVDVGIAQLDWKLRTDSRVEVLEKTNIKDVLPSKNISDVDFICVDVSFISVKTFAKNLKMLLKKGGDLIILVKPQFEAKREEVGTGGIVMDDVIRKRVIHEVTQTYENIGFKKVGVIESPITGAKGNVEFLLYMINE